MSLWHDLEFVTVDPGLRGCGLAWFKSGDLKCAAYIKNPKTEGRGPEAHASMALALAHATVGIYTPPLAFPLVAEFPRVYPGSAQQKGDLNDLLDLAGVVGAAAALWADNGRAVEHVFPSDWKGQVPADMMTERIRRALTGAERARIQKCPASLMHNVLDAVGIGLYKLNRLNKRVYHNG